MSAKPLFAIYVSVNNSTTIISGRLLKRIGMMLLPMPRLTSMLVEPAV